MVATLIVAPDRNPLWHGAHYKEYEALGPALLLGTGGTNSPLFSFASISQYFSIT